jgi:ketosteroid isomerase-like protein
MTDLQAIADRVEIEALRGEFTDAAMMRDYDRVASLFTPDGALRMPNIPAELIGPDQIRGWGARVPEIVEFLVQTTHPGTLVLNGDTASGRAYMNELVRTRDGQSELNYAIYHDHYRRTGDGWKFTERVYEVRYRDGTPLAGSAPGAIGTGGANGSDRVGGAKGLVGAGGAKGAVGMGGPGAVAGFGAAELEGFTRTFTELFDAGDPESMTAYYGEQAQLMAEGITPIQGRPAISSFWRAAISQAKAAGARRTIQLHESHCSGDLGYALCTVTVEVPGGVQRMAWDTTVWQRDAAGGDWRIAVDISALLPG